LSAKVTLIFECEKSIIEEESEPEEEVEEAEAFQEPVRDQTSAILTNWWTSSLITPLNKTKDSNETDTPAPIMEMSMMNAEGEIILTFDQDMLFPPELNRDFYKEAFNVSVKSSFDFSVAYGSFYGSLRELQSLEIGEEETRESDNLAFGMTVIEHSDREITFLAGFEEPQMVSAFGTDTFRLEVKNTGYFVSKETLKQLEFPDGKPILSKPLGRIIANIETVRQIESTVVLT